MGVRVVKQAVTNNKSRDAMKGVGSQRMLKAGRNGLPVVASANANEQTLSWLSVQLLAKHVYNTWGCCTSNVSAGAVQKSGLGGKTL